MNTTKTRGVEKVTAFLANAIADERDRFGVEVLAFNTGVPGQFTLEMDGHRWLVDVSSDEVDHD